MAGGRPNKYKPEYCEQLISCMEEGGSITEFASIINVSRSTIHEWKKKYPEFSDAVEIGKEKAEAWFIAKGKDMLDNNPGLWKFWMSAQFGWSEKNETKVEHEGSSISVNIKKDD